MGTKGLPARACLGTNPNNDLPLQIYFTAMHTPPSPAARHLPCCRETLQQTIPTPPGRREAAAATVQPGCRPLVIL